MLNEPTVSGFSGLLRYRPAVMHFHNQSGGVALGTLDLDNKYKT